MASHKASGCGSPRPPEAPEALVAQLPVCRLKGASFAYKGQSCSDRFAYMELGFHIGGSVSSKDLLESFSTDPGKSLHQPGNFLGRQWQRLHAPICHDNVVGKIRRRWQVIE